MPLLGPLAPEGGIEGLKKYKDYKKGIKE